MRGSATAAAALAFALLGGCQTDGKIARLNREIAETGERLVAVEREINAGAADIASEAEGVRAEVRYRPLVSWAQAFSAAPPAQRTISFQQTHFSGDIASQSSECRWSHGHWHYRPGFWVRFANDRATTISLYVERLAVTPESDGLSFSVPLQVKGKTQIKGDAKEACTGWNAGTNVGIGLAARPDTLFHLRFGQLVQNRLAYSAKLVRPDQIDADVSVGLGHIKTVHFNVPIKHMAQELAAGDVSLMYGRDGSIALPDGRRIGYHISTVNPAVRPNAQGVTVSSDFTIQIDQPPPRP